MNHARTRPTGPLTGMSTPMTTFDLNKAVQKLAGLPQHEHDHHKIAVILDLSRELPETTADRQQIECVLLTLFSRSLQAIIEAKKPHGTITVRTELKAEKIQFSITDDGLAFFKPEESNNLAICAGIVRDQEGDLYAWRPRFHALTTIVMNLPSLTAGVQERA